MKPRIAMVLGDPAGIGPELIAKLLSDDSARSEAEIVLIADRAEVEEGMRVANRRFEYQQIESLDNLSLGDVPQLYDFRGSSNEPFVRGKVSAVGGRYSLDTMKLALELTASGKTDSMLFAPLNKTSLHLGGMQCSDELHWFAERLGYEGTVCEFNVMDQLWTSRVTSHMALRDVALLITPPRVIEAIRLIHNALRQSGVENPRIGVCGFNPHCGDHGNFGREEIDVIEPAVAAARAAGFNAQGPFPADTIFLRVTGGRQDFDAIVTMYHDQGQIAIKLLGFSRGVSIQGGLPIPITTPAHGTAFDIAMKGVANVGATMQAFRIACRMGTTRRASQTAGQVAGG